jgi:hypothetical protein
MDRYIRCQAIAKSGVQCKSGAMPLTPFCGVHQGSKYPGVKEMKVYKETK